MIKPVIFEAKNISKHYSKHTALDDVSLKVANKCIFGLLGPNGAGKTTLIRIINQIIAPDSGELFLSGNKLNRSHITDIGYLPEERGLYKKMKVGEQALYLAELKGMDKKLAKQKLLEWFEKFEMTSWWNKTVEDLSKGMAQKVQFITTVIHEPKLLILDEPFSGFDPINTNLIKEEILNLKKQGASIILSTHNMNSVEEICDNFILLNNSKKVLSGKVNTVKEKFSAGLWDIKYIGNSVSFANAVWGGWKLLKQEQNIFKETTASIQLEDSLNINDFIKGIVDHVQIIGVKKNVPTMNDIFIKTISETS